MPLDTPCHLIIVPAMSDTPSLRERKKQKTRDQLFHAAVKLFKDKGFENTTVEEIADAALVSRRTFFRYFQTKEAVVFAQVPGAMDHFRTLLSEIHEDETPIAAVKRAALFMADEYMANREEIVALQKVVNASPALIGMETQIDLGWEGAIAETLAERMGGSPRAQRIGRLYGGALIGVIRATLREWMASEGTLDLRELGRESFELIERGFVAEHESDEEAA